MGAFVLLLCLLLHNNHGGGDKIGQKQEGPLRIPTALKLQNDPQDESGATQSRDQPLMIEDEYLNPCPDYNFIKRHYCKNCQNQGEVNNFMSQEGTSKRLVILGNRVEPSDVLWANYRNQGEFCINVQPLALVIRQDGEFTHRHRCHVFQRIETGKLATLARCWEKADP